MKVRFNGGIKDVPLSEVTADNYIVPQREERFWHVLQEKVEFNRNTGKRISQPVLQKYDTKAYPRTEKYLKDAGYTITVLHDPIAWEKANAEAAAKGKAQEEADKAEAAKKAKEAEREALKEELRKELLAELKAEKQEKKDKNTTKKQLNQRVRL
jgi:hypothetical protein